MSGVELPLRNHTGAGRWVLAATVLASSMAFLDGSVVNIALPAMGRSLHAGVQGLQWVLDVYLVTLGGLLLLGGGLGDRYGRRRMLVFGLVTFTASSVLCGVAWSLGVMLVARAVQGVGGALLVPESLAILSATFAERDRGTVIGQWSGLTGVSSAVAPLVGGWLISAVSWRAVFFINVPVGALALVLALRDLPETRDEQATGRPDLLGSALVSVALAALAVGLIERVAWAALAAIVVLGAFVVVERVAPHPVLPLDVFRSAQFSGANVTTFAVYGALGGIFFLVVLQLQVSLGYSALAAGLSMTPITVLMLLLSPRMGGLAQRIGPRLPMTVGPAVAALGALLFTRMVPGQSYASGVLPGALVFGLGLSITVAPLTATVLAAVPPRHVGVASGFNNAVSRVAGLVAVALLPTVTHMGTTLDRASVSKGFRPAMVICALSSAIGGAVAFFTVRREIPVEPTPQASVFQPCHDACRAAITDPG